MLRRDGTVVAYTVVDEADSELAQRYTWRLSTGYARAAVAPYRNDTLHRLIMGLKRGSTHDVDHINRNRLDNRRANLRLVTKRGQAENRPAFGASRFRGVHRHPHGLPWQARVMLAGVSHRLGGFLDEGIAGLVADSYRRAHMRCATLDPALLEGPTAALIADGALRCTGCDALSPLKEARHWLLTTDGPRCFDCNDAVLPKRGKPFAPPRPCAHCSKPITHGWRGRCNTCYAYWRRNGVDRPTI